MHAIVVPGFYHVELYLVQSNFCSVSSFVLRMWQIFQLRFHLHLIVSCSVMVFLFCAWIETKMDSRGSHDLAYQSQRHFCILTFYLLLLRQIENREEQLLSEQLTAPLFKQKDVCVGHTLI